MRKSLSIIIFLVFLIGGFWFFNNLRQQKQPAAAQTGNVLSVTSTMPVMQPSPLEQAALPKKFSIPKLGINNISVESVGLDKENKMDIPKDDNDVAWYNLGVKPGEKGNAVIDGHFDKKTGAPAVFYDLNKLKPGDELLIADENGKQYKYVVTEVKSYDLNKFPLQDVFGSTDKSRLNLITCDGVWNSDVSLYSNRLVVYSELKES